MTARTAALFTRSQHLHPIVFARISIAVVVLYAVQLLRFPFELPPQLVLGALILSVLASLSLGRALLEKLYQIGIGSEYIGQVGLPPHRWELLRYLVRPLMYNVLVLALWDADSSLCLVLALVQYGWVLYWLVSSLVEVWSASCSCRFSAAGCSPRAATWLIHFVATSWLIHFACVCVHLSRRWPGHAQLSHLLAWCLAYPFSFVMRSLLHSLWGSFACFPLLWWPALLSKAIALACESTLTVLLVEMPRDAFSKVLELRTIAFAAVPCILFLASLCVPTTAVLPGLSSGFDPAEQTVVDDTFLAITPRYFSPDGVHAALRDWATQVAPGFWSGSAALIVSPLRFVSTELLPWEAISALSALVGLTLPPARHPSDGGSDGVAAPSGGRLVPMTMWMGAKRYQVVSLLPKATSPSRRARLVSALSSPGCYSACHHYRYLCSEKESAFGILGFGCARCHRHCCCRCHLRRCCCCHLHLCCRCHLRRCGRCHLRRCCRCHLRCCCRCRPRWEECRCAKRTPRRFTRSLLLDHAEHCCCYCYCYPCRLHEDIPTLTSTGRAC